jgi:hypothetical protein
MASITVAAVRVMSSRWMHIACPHAGSLQTGLVCAWFLKLVVRRTVPVGLGAHALLEAAERVDMAATIHALEVLSIPSRLVGSFLGVLFARPPSASDQAFKRNISRLFLGS